ncbi:hypothetical protein PG993_000836 [Apiospora rasikravindrae]|uniref:Uncharacterized protein n=1 Tax=Apiospora rasikravindrae TaxID=990691 RepID=A0ABR1UCG8_9PEZI
MDIILFRSHPGLLPRRRHHRRSPFQLTPQLVGLLGFGHIQLLPTIAVNPQGCHLLVMRRVEAL